jgi:hypothetical protein
MTTFLRIRLHLHWEKPPRTHTDDPHVHAPTSDRLGRTRSTPPEPGGGATITMPPTTPTGPFA